MNIGTTSTIKQYDNMKHILIVDDDAEISDLLSEFLKIHHYIVSKASNTTEAELLIQKFIFDAIIMDVMMPGEDGINYIKRQRNKLSAPVIMLTALGGIDDRIGGLENGADDYLTKPFEPKELLLRMEKLIARYVDQEKFNLIKQINPENQLHYKLVKFGEFTFDLTQNKLKKNGINIHLTNVEAKLLNILATNAAKTIARSKILEECTKNEININLRTIDTQIARLRNKIEVDPKKAEFLSTTRGSGYILWATPI